MKQVISVTLFGLLVSLVGLTAQAEVKLPAVFGDHMVLQQNQKINVWGWADAGEHVQVSIGDVKSDLTSADKEGNWRVELPALKASKVATTIVVKGTNLKGTTSTVEIKDVLIGEVWLCSGQSNMEWTVVRSSNAEKEIAAAQHPLIRHIKVPWRQSNIPLDNFDSKWEVCSPETVGEFTACGYFMARHLQKELDVPIGLVNSTWGGTRIEPWTPLVGFERVEKLRDIYQSVLGRTPGTIPYRERLANYVESIEQWTAKAKEAINSNEVLTPSPAYPSELVPFGSNQDPTMLYNGMIHALVGFPIRGAIWYQGESNHDEGMAYFEKMKALVQGWREIWNHGIR